MPTLISLGAPTPAGELFPATITVKTVPFEGSSWFTGRWGQRNAAALVALVVLVAGVSDATALSPTAGASSALNTSCAWTNPAVVSSHTSLQLANMIMTRMSLAEQVTLTGLHNQVNGVAENVYDGDPALCIPSFVLQDGPMGITVSGSPQMPSDIALGATFDSTLAQQYGAALGSTAATDGISAIQGPDANTTQMPTWGRRSETLGESPFLAGLMAARMTQGIAATGTQVIMKHAGVYVREYERMASDEVISTRGLEESYLSPLRPIVALRPLGDMCAYGQLNGVNQCLSSQVKSGLTSMGFTGLTRSDFGGVGGGESQAIAAGVNLIKSPAAATLLTAVNDGILSQAALSNAVRGVLVAMFDHHMFDHPRTFDASANTMTPGSTAVSTAVSENGSVLLKNSGVLPLRANTSVSVISATLNRSNVYTATATTGDIYSASGSFAVNTDPQYQVSPYEGLTAALGASNVTQTIATASAGGTQLLSPAVLDTARRANGMYVTSVSYDATQAQLVDFNLSVSFFHPYGSANVAIDGKPFLRYEANRNGVITDEQATHLSQGVHTITVTFSDPSRLDAPSLTATDVTGAIAQAVAAAQAATYAVVNVTTGNLEGEAQDLATLELPGYQDQLIEAVARVNRHTIVVINSGGAVLMPWLHSVSAVVEQWFAGQTDGTALAALLSGAVNFSGHLPVTFPSSDSAVPYNDFSNSSATFSLNGPDGLGLDTGYLWYRATKHRPLFPFGYGLSYTHFSLSRPSIVSSGGNWVLHVTATNTGRVAGRVVVQGYLTAPTGAHEPARQLKVVGSASLAAGASGTLTMTLTGMALQSYQGTEWISVPGQYRLFLGQSSSLTPLNVAFWEKGTPAIASSFTTPSR